MCGLVKAFFENDPYDSRPIPTDQIYISFKTGYLNACDPEDRIFATAFLTAIETEQATRSTSNGYGEESLACTVQYLRIYHFLNRF